ncbi:MAG: hypothetical protein Q7L55_02405 [Actinomycetota bacterium]|nr:hypothetical protein [Actinomycetota bacterium]
MTFPDINFLSVILSTVTAFIVGFIWFGLRPSSQSGGAGLGAGCRP